MDKRVAEFVRDVAQSIVGLAVALYLQDHPMTFDTAAGLALRLRHPPHLPGRAATHQAGAGDVAVAVAQPHANKDLPILMHLEPPIGHVAFPPVPLAWKRPEDTLSGRRSETSNRHPPGAIMPILPRPHYADPRMAPCARSLTLEAGPGVGRRRTGGELLDELMG